MQQVKALQHLWYGRSGVKKHHHSVMHLAFVVKLITVMDDLHVACVPCVYITTATMWKKLIKQRTGVQERFLFLTHQ